jgi:hypothetical protein
MADDIIARLHNLHQGEACFIVGNGPSLQQMPLQTLEGHWFFGVNRGYLAYALGLPTIPYYMFADPIGYATLAEEVRRARVGLRFYRSDVCQLPAYALAPDREEALELSFHVEPGMDEGYFARHLAEGLYRGFTVILNVVQIAYHMGFREVYLIGCDLSYEQPQTHFYPTGVYEETRRYDMPVPRVVKSFAVARQVFEADGRRLVNATVGGALEVLPRESFEEVIQRLPRAATARMPGDLRGTAA